MNAGLNFQTFVAELARRTTARTNYGVRFLLQRKSLTQANYQSVTDFETELLWLWNTRGLG